MSTKRVADSIAAEDAAQRQRATDETAASAPGADGDASPDPSTAALASDSTAALAPKTASADVSTSSAASAPMSTAALAPDSTAAPAPADTTDSTAAPAPADTTDSTAAAAPADMADDTAAPAPDAEPRMPMQPFHFPRPLPWMHYDEDGEDSLADWFALQVEYELEYEMAEPWRESDAERRDRD